MSRSHTDLLYLCDSETLWLVSLTVYMRLFVEFNRGRVWCLRSTILADWTLYATLTIFLYNVCAIGCPCDYQSPLHQLGYNWRCSTFQPSTLHYWGQRNSTVVSAAVYEADDPGSCPERSACYRRVELTVLLSCSHQCQQLVKKSRPCVIMSV